MINRDRCQNEKNAGLALIWVVITAFGLITVLGVGRAIKGQKDQQKQIPAAKTPSGTATPVLDQAREEQRRVFSPSPTPEQLPSPKIPTLISESPCAKDLDSKECEDFIRQQCEADPYISECLEVFHYAGKVACEKNPQSEDCRLYQEYKDQAQPATGLTKEMQDTLNRIRTLPLPFSGQPSFGQPGPRYTYDYEDYLLLQEEADFGHIYPGHPDYHYYQELRQQFGQLELPPIYLNPLNDPNINPLANPDINPLMNPNINPLANPDINPMADPSLNPGCIPCQFGRHPSLGQWGEYSGRGGFGGRGR